MKGGYGQAQPGQMQGDGQTMAFMQQIGQAPGVQAWGQRLAQRLGQMPRPPVAPAMAQQTPTPMAQPMWRNGINPAR